jgi:hypothetical protein
VIVYHGSFHRHERCPVARESTGPFGLHFGSRKAALERLAHIREKGFGKRTGYIYAVDLRPKNVLRKVKDAGIWHNPKDVAYVLAKRLGKGGDLDSSVFGAPYMDFSTLSDPEQKRMQDLLFLHAVVTQKGYDCIGYRNAYEAKGSTSYIPLDGNIIHACLSVEEVEV